MLKTAVHWMLIVGAIADLILLLRILGLKLHRLYAFITLDAALGLLFDATGWWLGWDSREYARVYFYSRFLYAAVVQAVAWDVFEESIHSLGESAATGGSAIESRIDFDRAACDFFAVCPEFRHHGRSRGLVFHRHAVVGEFLRDQSAFSHQDISNASNGKIVIPHNTVVWARFYQLSFACSLVDSALLFSGLNLGSTASGALDVAFIGFELALVSWCVVRLQGVPQNGSAAMGSRARSCDGCVLIRKLHVFRCSKMTKSD